MFRNHLMYRLIINNGCATAVLAWAWGQGFLSYIKYDGSRISFLILAAFAVAMFLIFSRAMKATSAMNAIKAGRPMRDNPVKFLAKSGYIEELGLACLSLGMTGTVIGVIEVLFGGGLSLDGTIESVTKNLAASLSGAGVAFITTAVGMITSTWIFWNYRILSIATTCMIEDSEALGNSQ